jgi:hypothetical protein
MSLCIPIVGLRFRPPEARETLALLGVGDHLTLRREPGNPHDSNAIQVLIPAGTQLGVEDSPPLEAEVLVGYIGRETAAQLAPLLDKHGGDTSAHEVCPIFATFVGGNLLSIEGIEENSDV